jgi:TetR/AcrR family transcriptional regulator, regulator of cefoperazone and chloramphenicol sensitivity
MVENAIEKEHAVRQRLITAAAEVFAEKGFSQATIRKISSQAHANVAAVSYYWTDKKNLYIKVIESLIAERMQSFPLTAAMDESLPGKERLKKFIELFMRRLLKTDQPAWSSKIMVREMTEPTEAIRIVLDKLIKPSFDVLNSIVRAIYGRDIAETKVKLAVVSIISQCVYYFNTRNIMESMVDSDILPPFDLDEIVNHITEFSFKALSSH